MDNFFANLYELFGKLYLGNFSDDMFNNGFYNPIGIVMFASVTLFAVLYYYVINHPRWNRWFWWLTTGGVLSVLNFGAAWIMADSFLVKLYAAQVMIMPYGMPEFLPFSVTAGCLTFFFFFVFSFIIKWGSRNCKHSPFL